MDNDIGHYLGESPMVFTRVWRPWLRSWHYIDVIMTTMASQITSLTVVYSTVYSDADQSKDQSFVSLAFVWWIHRDRWIPRTKSQLRGKCFHLMTSSWNERLMLVFIGLVYSKHKCRMWNKTMYGLSWITIMITREANCQWFSFVTALFVKITGE